MFRAFDYNGRAMLRKLYPRVQPLVRRVGFALASIWRRCLWRTTFIAVSGSVGKSTAKNAIAAVLEPHFPTHRTRGSSNHYIGLFKTIFGVRPWHRYAVIEIGLDRPGQMEMFVALVRPQVAVWTAVARTHLQSMRTLETIAYEKSRMIEALPAGGLAILNYDNPHIAAYQPPAGVKVIRYGTSDGVDLRAHDIRAAFPDRLSFAIDNGPRIETQLVGHHWVTSILPAIAIGEHAGLSREQITSALRTLAPMQQRMSPAETPQGATFLRDERNGSIDTLETALTVLAEAHATRKVFVFTDVSDSTLPVGRRKARIARTATTIADVLVFVGESNRHSVRGAIEAGAPEEHVHGCYSIEEAATTLREILRPGDLVLLRGRLADHLSRIYLHTHSDVTCWRETCPKKCMCDTCPELRRPAAPAAAGSH